MITDNGLIYNINETAEILLLGDITQELATDFTAVMVALDTNDKVKDITIGICSGGGECIAGMGMFTTMLKSSKPVTTVNEGFACSIAGVFFYGWKKTLFSGLRSLDDASSLGWR